MAKLSVLDIKGKETEKIDLPDDIFGGPVKKRLLYQAITMYRACQRQGTASTKERADVHGGGRKPYRQKGTGQARVGSRRSPIWKGGGVTFGPHPRDFSYTIPKKIKKEALRAGINAKFKTNNLVCVAEIKDKLNKTKDFAQILENLKLQGKTLALLDGSDDGIQRVSRNIPRFDLMRSTDVNAYDLLRHKNILLTKAALENLLKRLN